jgi:hypothetical protein
VRRNQHLPSPARQPVHWLAACATAGPADRANICVRQLEGERAARFSLAYDGRQKMFMNMGGRHVWQHCASDMLSWRRRWQRIGFARARFAPAGSSNPYDAIEPHRDELSLGLVGGAICSLDRPLIMRRTFRMRPLWRALARRALARPRRHCADPSKPLAPCYSL